MWVLYQDEERQSRTTSLLCGDCSYCEVSVLNLKSWSSWSRTWSDRIFLQRSVAAKHGTSPRPSSQPAHGIHLFSLRLSKSEKGSEFFRYPAPSMKSEFIQLWIEKVQCPHPSVLHRRQLPWIKSLLWLFPLWRPGMLMFQLFPGAPRKSINVSDMKNYSRKTLAGHICSRTWGTTSRKLLGVDIESQA